MKINDFKVGDVLLVTTKMKNGYETRSAQVFCINYKNNGLVTFTGINLHGFESTGSSAFDPQKIGKSLFGIKEICVVDHKNPIWHEFFQGPKPGDRGYDLMC